MNIDFLPQISVFLRESASYFYPIIRLNPAERVEISGLDDDLSWTRSWVSTGSTSVASVGVTFPLPLDRRHDVGDLYLVRSLPTTFFIDADGIIREIRVGGPMALDFLNEQVRRMR